MNDERAPRRTSGGASIVARGLLALAPPGREQPSGRAELSRRRRRLEHQIAHAARQAATTASRLAILEAELAMLESEL